MPCAGASHFREGCLRSPGVSTSKEPTTWEPCRNTSVQLPPAHPGPLLPARTLSWFLVSSSFFLPSPLEFIFSSIKHILSCEGNRGNGLIADSGFLSLVASLRLGSKWLSMPRHPELKYREMRTHFPSLQRSLFLSGCACFSIFIF